jgi:hypothetical protein
MLFDFFAKISIFKRLQTNKISKRIIILSIAFVFVTLVIVSYNLDTFLWWNADEHANFDETQFNITVRVGAMSLYETLNLYRRSSFELMKDPKREVICALSMLQTENCDAENESMAHCISRFGKMNWEKILGDRCIKTNFWKNQLKNIFSKLQHKHKIDFPVETDNQLWKQMKRGVIFDSQILSSSSSQKPQQMVPPSQRTYAPFPPAKVCRSGCKTYPIAFGLPRSYFVDKVPRTKTFEWMPSMPKPTPSTGKSYDAKPADEDLFRQLYTQSFFAWTHSRAGWDCLRHYEIISGGALPFFWDLDRCPHNTLGHLPKEMLMEIREMPGVDHILPPTISNSKALIKHQEEK